MSDIDIEKHMTDDEIVERVEIEHKGDELWFELQELSGAEADKVWDNNLTINADGSDIDLTQYRLDYIKKRVVNTNVPKFSIFIEGCDPPIYKELKKHVKYPEEGDAIDEGN